MTIQVEKFLKSKNIPYRLVNLSSPVKSHVDLIKKPLSSVDIQDDCKTIIVSDEKGKSYALFLRGMEKIDFSKANEVTNAKLSVVDKDVLLKLTGKTPGNVCPLLLQDIPIFVDSNVLNRKRLFFSSGEPGLGLEISTDDFRKAIPHQIVTISKIS